MLDKKITRKQFVLSALSLVGLFFLSGLPKKLIGQHENSTETKNTYGESVYGGTKNE